MIDRNLLLAVENPDNFSLKINPSYKLAEDLPNKLYNLTKIVPLNLRPQTLKTAGIKTSYLG
jgi:hypothetical protein